MYLGISNGFNVGLNSLPKVWKYKALCHDQTKVKFSSNFRVNGFSTLSKVASGTYGGSGHPQIL